MSLLRIVSTALGILLLLIATALPASAQVEAVDIAFSSEKIGSYGFPELLVTFNGSEFEVPTAVEAGYHVVVLTPSADTAV